VTTSLWQTLSQLPVHSVIFFGSGLQGDTIRKIGLVWVTTLPAAILLAAGLFTTAGYLIPSAGPAPRKTGAAVLAPERPDGGFPQIAPAETRPR